VRAPLATPDRAQPVGLAPLHAAVLAVVRGAIRPALRPDHLAPGEHLVPGDAVGPGGKRLCGKGFVHLVPEDDVGFLEHIVGGVGRAEQGEDVGIEPILMTGEASNELVGPAVQVGSHIDMYRGERGSHRCGRRFLGRGLVDL